MGQVMVGLGQVLLGWYGQVELWLDQVRFGWIRLGYCQVGLGLNRLGYGQVWLYQVGLWLGSVVDQTEYQIYQVFSVFENHMIISMWKTPII